MSGEEAFDSAKLMDGLELQPAEMVKAIQFLMEQNEKLMRLNEQATAKEMVGKTSYKSHESHLKLALKNVDFKDPLQVTRFCIQGERNLEQDVWPNTLEFGTQIKLAITLPAGSWNSLGLKKDAALPRDILLALNSSFGRQKAVLSDQKKFNIFRVPDEKVTEDNFRLVTSEYIHLFLKAKDTVLDKLAVKEAMKDFGRRFENPAFQGKWDKLAEKEEVWNDLVQNFLEDIEFTQVAESSGPEQIVCEENRRIPKDKGKVGEGSRKTHYLLPLSG